MAQNLVIVESPAKAKTIEKFLGKDFKVASSFGHIADLPSKELGVDVEGDFSAKYIVSSDKKKLVSELKSLAKKSETGWLASDEDREGEAIAWHLANTLELNENNSKRIVFSEITKNAILKAIEKPRSIDYNLVNANLFFNCRWFYNFLFGPNSSICDYQKIWWIKTCCDRRLDRYATIYFYSTRTRIRCFYRRFYW